MNLTWVFGIGIIVMYAVMISVMSVAVVASAMTIIQRMMYFALRITHTQRLRNALTVKRKQTILYMIYARRVVNVTVKKIVTCVDILTTTKTTLIGT